MRRCPQSVRTLVRVYRWLLWFYPVEFRRRFGSEMTALFEEVSREAAERHGTAGLLLTMFHVLVDTLRSAPREWVYEVKGSIHDVAKMDLVSRWRIAVVLCLTAAMLLTPADIASTMLLGILVFGIYICAAISSRLPYAIRTMFVAFGALPPVWLIAALNDMSHQRASVTLIVILPLVVTSVAIGVTLAADRAWARRCESLTSSQKCSSE